MLDHQNEIVCIPLKCVGINTAFANCHLGEGIQSELFVQFVHCGLVYHKWHRTICTLMPGSLVSHPGPHPWAFLFLCILLLPPPKMSRNLGTKCTQRVLGSWFPNSLWKGCLHVSWGEKWQCGFELLGSKLCKEFFSVDLHSSDVSSRVTSMVGNTQMWRADYFKIEKEVSLIFKGQLIFFRKQKFYQGIASRISNVSLLWSACFLGKM